MTRAAIISNNIKYNAISQTVTFIVSFFLFPFIVSHVGKEVYGAYILVMTFTGYLGIMDFGVPGAIIKYVAEFLGRGDRKKVNEIISASFSFYVLIGFVAAILLLSFSFCFDLIFQVEKENRHVVSQLFWVAAGAALFVWPGRTFEDVLRGFQRYEWLAIINTGATIFTGISAYLIFTQGLSIVFFLAVSNFLIILRYLSAYIIANHFLLKQKIKFPYFNREVLRTIFSFSFFIFLSSLTNIFIFHVDDFVVGAFVSVSAVTLYNVAYNLQNGFRTINSLIGGPLFPACAEMEGKNEYEKQKMLLFKGTRYMTMVFVPMVIITIIFAESLIKSWMGNGFAESILPAQVLMAFWLFNGTLEVGSGMLSAKGYVNVVFKIGVINALSNLAISLILVRYLGILGVALGTTIPMVLISFPLVLHKIFKVLDVTFIEYFNLAIKNNLGIYLLAVGLSILMRKFLVPTGLWMVLLEMGVVYLITIFAGYRRFLSVEERREVKAMVRF